MFIITEYEQGAIMPQNTVIANTRRAPRPCFDTLETVDQWVTPAELDAPQARDFAIAVKFLRNYVGSQGTFNSYRREVERLLQWTWHIALMTIGDLKREDIEAFIRFCQRPPKAWIGLKKPPRFVAVEGERRPNSEWRPFVATVSKSAHKKGEAPSKKDYFASNNSIKQLMAICRSFYQYLLLEEYVYSNPVALIRQKVSSCRSVRATLEYAD